MWPNIDLNQGLIHLVTGAGNKGRAIVPINDELLIARRKAREQRRQPRDPARQRGGQEQQDRVQGGLPPRQVGRRHASHVVPHGCHVDGVPLAEISRYLGHSSEKLTEKVCAKHTPEYLRRASASLTTRPSTGQLAPNTKS